MTTEEYITEEEYLSGQREYWRQVEASDGFDIEKVSLSSPMYGMITGLTTFNCDQRGLYPHRILVNLYAKVGLHRYNMMEGTSFQLNALVKFNMSPTAMASFYMTLLAHDPTDSTLQKTFQVQVDEGKCGHLDMTCSTARLKDEVTSKKPFIPHFHGSATTNGIFKGDLPEWPSDDALNDGKRFYVVKKSEWEATDWISLYLEIVICANEKWMEKRLPHNDFLSKLEIVKVAIETGIEDVEPPNERLKAKSANVYIMFKGLAEARALRRVFEIGEHVERKAIVRRVMDGKGYLTLKGKLCGGQSTDTRTCKKRPHFCVDGTV